MACVTSGCRSWRCWSRRWSRSWAPWCCSWTASGRCWRDQWSASSAARRCCFRARPPAGASALLSSFEASSAVTRSSRDWMAAAMLPEAAVFAARSVTCNRHKPFFGRCPRGVPRGVPPQTARTAQRLQRQLQTAPRESANTEHSTSLFRGGFPNGFYST